MRGSDGELGAGGRPGGGIGEGDVAGGGAHRRALGLPVEGGVVGDPRDHAALAVVGVGVVAGGAVLALGRAAGVAAVVVAGVEAGRVVAVGAGSVVVGQVDADVAD